MELGFGNELLTFRNAPPPSYFWDNIIVNTLTPNNDNAFITSKRQPKATHRDQGVLGLYT